jgi:hypothetical protein
MRVKGVTHFRAVIIVAAEEGGDAMISIRHLLPFSLLVACSSAASESTTSTGSALTGPFDVRLALDADGDLDPALPAVARIVVTISRVDAKLDEGPWTTLSLGTTTVDLLSLPANGFASLGIARLPASGVEKLRLSVSGLGPDYVVTADGVRHALVVPSDSVEVIGDLDAEACATGHVTLGFAGRGSIVVHPLDDGTVQWVLRPVIRVEESVAQEAACEADDRGQEQEGRDPGR